MQKRRQILLRLCLVNLAVLTLLVQLSKEASPANLGSARCLVEIILSDRTHSRKSYELDSLICPFERTR